LIPGSLWEVVVAEEEEDTASHYRPDIPTKGSNQYQEWSQARSDDYVNEYVKDMERLVTRLEEEGEYYQKMAEEHRLAQLAPTVMEDATTASTTTTTATTDKASGSKKSTSLPPKQKPMHSKSIPETYSSPGPTVTLYELLLDAYALSTLKTTNDSFSPPNALSLLTHIDSIYQRIVQRHDLDGQYQNTHPQTIPTSITYNAILRIIANGSYIPSSQNTISNLPQMDIPTQKVRDQALLMAFQTYEMMEASDAVHRNSCTYEYLFQILQTYIPPCRSRGNILRQYVHQACEEGVMTVSILQNLKLTCDKKDGLDYEEWMSRMEEEFHLTAVEDHDDDDHKGAATKDLPLKWRRVAKKLSHKSGNGFY